MALADRFGLDGRVAVVTGGASGIGAGIVRVLAEAGAHVVVADRDAAMAAEVVSIVGSAGGSAEAAELQLEDEGSIVATCARVVARHGAPWLLVNNAGFQDRQPLGEMAAGFWDRTYTVNARAPFLMVRELTRAMVEAGAGGRVVNVASNSVRAPQVVGLAAYASSKGALETFSMTAAFELLPHGITVNTVLPGGVITPGAINAKGGATSGPAASRRSPLGFCEPEDIAAAVLFFASPAARFVTAQSVMVDAGFSLT